MTAKELFDIAREVVPSRPFPQKLIAEAEVSAMLAAKNGEFQANIFVPCEDQAMFVQHFAERGFSCSSTTGNFNGALYVIRWMATGQLV